MKVVVRGVGVACLLLSAACALRAPPPPAPPRQTNLGLKISGFELANGLRVVLVEEPRAAEIQVTMRYQIGSVDDPPEHAGMAHLVEHLMYQQVLGADSLFAHLENATSYFNAETSLDATTYVARARPEKLGELLSIEAVRVGLRCTSITDSAFAREREVVLNELRQRDEASDVLAAIHRGLYPAGHPYRRGTGGTEESVAAITRDQACAFAEAHYTTTNAVLVVSGDITAPQVDTALHKFLGRVVKRTATPPTTVPAIDATVRHVESPAPIDDDALLLAWPLPSDPLLRVRVRAIAKATESLVDQQISGRAMLTELGDGRAPMLGVLVLPGADESMDDVLKAAERGVDAVPASFGKLEVLGDLEFDRIQQTAIYKLFATLEDGGDRDTRLASYVLAGRDPSEVLGAELQGLRTLTRDDAARIAEENLSFERATVVVLKSTGGKKRGHPVGLGVPIHDLGRRRDPADPADAHRPLAGSVEPRGLSEVRTRQLPNGLKVVLLPLTSVPTVDVRLVFGSGTADESPAQRGAALVAADTLTWDLHYLNDLLRFAAAGGTDLVDVDTDRTTFTARGLDMHLDLLLAGLRRWIREGKYEPNAARVLDAMRREGKKADDSGTLTDAWRTALYGARHPYVAAGLVRYASDTLTTADATRFRAARYTPDNATLVIAGRFDAALADRWIDYLFADWTGHAEPRSSVRTTSQPASIARAEDTAQVQLRIAMPAIAGDRARQLVAAAMLADLAGDVRHQLGASYGLASQLVESRLATNYLISGSVDAARAREAIELLRTRIAALPVDRDVAARSFVAARNQVLAHLVSVTGSAAVLAERVERDIELQRAPMSDLQTAHAVQALTIDQMAETLADLDLSRAVILMRGPAAEIDGAFDALGRKPTYVRGRPADRDTHDPPPSPEPPGGRSADSLSLADLAVALTDQAAPTSLAIAVAPGYSSAQIAEHDASGFSLAGHVAYRFDEHNAAGLHASIGYVSGTYATDFVTAPTRDFSVIPIDLAACAQATGLDRLWGMLFFGLHLDRVSDNGTTWQAGIGAGLEGGVDILKLGPHRLGAFGRVQGEMLTATGYVAFTFGVAYRQ